MRLTAALLSLTLASACDPSPKRQPETNLSANVAGNDAAPAIPPPATGPDARIPLAEPHGAIDPKSTEAAGQVVQHYGALIEQRRTEEAARLWGSADGASDFAGQLERYPEAHLEIGKPGDMEGAAGSVYVSVPVVFYGKDGNRTDFRRAANVILRRANDVPGSTARQRRWHIERIEWK